MVNKIGGVCFCVLCGGACLNIMEGVGLEIAVPALLTWAVLAIHCFWKASDKDDDDKKDLM